MPVEITEPVNLTRSLFLCNLFSFFFSASKSCLLPFLTIYLRILGLTATQTGFIIGAKTFSTFIFAPLWSKCAIQFHRRRLVLMIALFMMAVTYLPLTLLTNISPSVKSCDSQSTQKNSQPLPTTESPIHINSTHSLAVTHNLMPKNSTISPSFPYTTVSPATVSSTVVGTVPTKEKKNDEDEVLNQVKDILVGIGMNKDKVKVLTADDIFKQYLKLAEDKEAVDSLKKYLSEDEKAVMRDFLSRYGVSVRRRREISWENMRDAVHEKLEQAKQNLFIVVLVILIVGEAFCSPVEKIADDSWFEFLEQIDDMEKYGKHRIWSSLANMFFPVIVTLVVDNTTCLFDLKVYPFMFHFYAFGALLGITFLISFLYPVPSAPKSKYKSKLGTALRKVCCTCGGLLYMLTLVIMGFIFASHSNFLFWLIQDLKGKEITMGLCILVASLSELVVLVFSSRLVKVLGNGGMISISLLCLAGRLLYYSYLWTPWAVLPVEIFHAVTHTMMWFVVLSNKAFRVSPTIDRAIRSVLSSAYFGVGFGVGSLVSGVMYDQYGIRILFRALSILSVGWCPVFFLLQKCCHPKQDNEIKYTRLLQSDDHSDDDVEDDWLEHALKDR
ncbi:major facilitator superfamily domain-containing protein 6-like [Saccostrea echinata]|uniref:major facilitator superfamily domain-containing protein 6-like n=1 Tax=Saccostrea echinata TaxID=191078 RepID=UPI002A82E74D|nr:major facilitator superfamily domain-containing protein 6-like [Saccostrea echinata]